ncbi:hypothetical protein [Nonomuraea sp. NPDC050310]|uniref:hypothetical protein n=1 Tax=Nonomuraea sp. NPDC050310 TaxID=3154935 RepID=UPI0033E54EEF
MTRCPHNRADPRMCPECRDIRLGLRAAPVTAVARAIARQATADQGLVAPPDLDVMLAASADLLQVLARAGFVVVRQRDAQHLVHVAEGLTELRAAVLVRVSDALAEAPRLQLVSRNAVPPDGSMHDHETEGQPPLTDPSPG